MMNNLFIRHVFLSSIAASIVACSGGGGGGGTSTSTSMLQASKMSCGGSTCIGNGTLSLMSKEINPYSVTTAVELYDTFNKYMIPAMNDIIAKIETGVSQAGAESCNDIDVPFSGAVTISGTLYDVKTTTTSVSAPTAFTTTTMEKAIAGRQSSPVSPFIQGDVACGAGTDASPLVARIIAQEGTSQLNAWFEKGSSNHIRILMITKYQGHVYAGWFKTNDGDSFEMVLASNGQSYKAVGKKSLGSIFFDEGGGDSCINATTGGAATNCAGNLSATSTISVSGIPSTLTGSDVTWSSINDSLTLTSPSY